MNKTIFLPLLLLAGCATTGPYGDYGYDRGYDRYDRPYNYGSGYDYAHRPANNYHNHTGTVVSVRYVENNNIGAGAVVGSIVGGVVGSQIGDGRGRTAATVGGAIAGGVIGHQVQRSRNNTNQAVDVRLDGGEVVTIIQDDNVRYVAGQRVRIWGTGANLRLVAENQYRY